MKKILVIAALLAVMLALDILQTDGFGGANVLTLAAIGFVLLAAYASAELGSAWSLPRVTGYILAGAVLGPSAGNILSGEVVAEMRMFNTLALGLIATSAGLELDVRQLVPLARTLTITTLLKVVLGVTLVGGALIGVAQFIPLTGIDNSGQLIALALVMGTLSIGTSPSITLAVLSETRAKGRLTDLVLGAAVFKDLVVVVCLALVGAVARTLLEPGTELESSVLINVGQELGGSLFAGALLGAVLIAYVRFIKAEMLLFVAAMILVVAELARAFHLELLLVFIAAGFVVRNFSDFAHDLMKPLELVALPVFVVFFTNAGAGVDLMTTWQILPVALVLCLVRALVYYLSAKVGAHYGREPKAVAENAWLAYLPQAGVTLGLVGLAVQQLPQIGPAIATTGMAVVALNLFIGPIVLRRALGRANEIPEQDDARASEPGIDRVSIPSSNPPLMVAAVLREPDLRASVDDLRGRVSNVLQAFVADVAGGLPALPSPTAQPDVEVFRHFVRSYRNAYRRLFDELVSTLAELPSQLTVPVYPEDFLPQPGEPWHLRVRLLRHRLGLTLPTTRRVRHVPLRLAARLTLEPSFAELASQAYEASIHQHAFSSGQLPDTLSLERWQETVERGFLELTRLLSIAGTSRCRGRQLRFSSVEPASRQALGVLGEAKEDYWVHRLQAVWGSRVAEQHIVRLERTLQQAIAVTVNQRAVNVLTKVEPAMQRVAAVLDAMREETPAALARSMLEDEAERWQREVEATRAAVLEEIARELRASATMRELSSQLKEAVSELPATVQGLQLKADRIARNGDVRRVQLRALAERDLIKALIPVIDHGARSTSSAFAQLPRRVRDVFAPIYEALEALADNDSPQLAQRLEEELELAQHRLGLVERRVERQVNGSLEQIDAAFAQAIQRLRADVATQGAAREPTSRLVERLIERLQLMLRPWLEWLTDQGRGPRAINDATDLRRTMEQWQGEVLPEEVRRWFGQAPVRDERIFTAHRQTLERIVDDEATWLNGGRASVLIKGPVGAGKSSLLNMCELELRSARVLRLDAEGPEQTGSLKEAFALALGCSQREGTLFRQLQLQRPVILLDNLEVWVGRGQRRVEELERLVEFVSTTQSTVFWVVAMENTTLALCEELVNIAEGFTRVIECEPLTAAELGDLVEARRVRAGVDLHYERTLMGRFFARLGISSDRDLFFRALLHTSRGNPARALAECLRVARMVNGRVVFSTDALRATRVRIGQVLSTSQLAVLALIVRQGPLDDQRLRKELGIGHQQLQRHLSFLLGAGILALVGDRQSYDVAEDARWPVVLELRRLGAVQ